MNTTFKMPERPIRTSAKALIVENGKILLTKNSDLLGDFFLMPGGGQEHGETLVDATKRECLEEIGAKVEVGKLLTIREYISANHEFGEFDPSIHQVEFIFQCKLLEKVCTSKAIELDAMQTGIEWIPINKLSEYRVFPSAIAKFLQDGIAPENFPTYIGDTL